MKIVNLSLLFLFSIACYWRVDNAGKNLLGKHEPKNIYYNMAEIENKDIDDNQKQLFPEPDKPPNFYLREGEWKLLPRDWEAKFEKIIKDNRCPARLPAVCEVAGSATIQIQLRRKGDAKIYTKVFKVEGLNRFNEKLKEGLLHPVTIHAKDNGIENKNQSIIITLADLHPYSLLDPKANNGTAFTALLRVVPAYPEKV